MKPVSVITVTYNAGDFLEPFFASLLAADTTGIDLEVLVIDNGSTDGTVDLVRDRFGQFTLLQNDENNYARALNLGISRAKGDFIVITNNDATVDPGWLQGFLDVMDMDQDIGAVQSKIYFEGSGKINSTGVQEVEHYYFADIGFEEDDGPDYAEPARRDYVTGGSVMFRHACLEDVGPWDEEFIMFMEDVDYSQRCRARDWQLWYSPSSVIHHQYHGSSSQAMCEFFCTRNRFLFVAKHFPMELVECIPTSHFYKKGEYDMLYRSLLHSVRAMCRCNDTDTVRAVLRALARKLPGYLGDVSTYLFFSQLEVVLGLRRIRVGIYDHAGHFAGGGQRYVAEMAAIMQERYDVTYIFNNDVSLEDYREWFDIDLGRSSMKIIRIPFFDKRERFTADEGMVLGEKFNVFDIIAKESLNYDIFVNANMLGKVNPLSPMSIFVCHFPDQEKKHYFQVDKYDYLMINGDYTGHWVEQRWGLQPTHKLYPPVNMYNPDSTAEDKEKIILSVSRFEVSGSKKQVELVEAFTALCRNHPADTAGWKLVMMGGSTPENEYLDIVREEAARSGCDIEVHANAAVSDIRENYRRASIFWHACGLDETKPERVEHFGMTTVESMQNYCVPIVIDGGGQREIVEQGDSGFRFSSLVELQEHSLAVMRDPARRLQMARSAYERSHMFSTPVFRQKLEALLDDAERELLGRDVLPGPDQ